MKDLLLEIRKPIDDELSQFITYFNDSLSHTDGLLNQALNYIRQRAGKRMRPILTLLIAKAFGQISEKTYRASVGLELLHTASLVHDDIVDEAGERRGQRSVNAVYDNKVAVLVGDYILSTALLNVALTNNIGIVEHLSLLGQRLSNGEILQLTSNGSEEISEDAYYEVIKLKTAALFEACCIMGAMSVDATDEEIKRVGEFGQNLGIIFQIRDDIFDYYDSKEIGKPTGNDMTEGKLTLPAIYALKSTGNESMLEIAKKVKEHEVTQDEIAQLIAFTKANGGIEYAKQRMEDFSKLCSDFIEQNIQNDDIKVALTAYLDYVIGRTY